MGIANYFKNLSPSKVNGFLDWRSKWFLQDILKRRLPGTPDMERGKAVEVGITSFLTGNVPDLEQAQAWAMKAYNDYSKDLDVDDAAECGKAIPELVRVGIEAMKPYGKLVSVQRKVYGKIGGTELDWFGYADIEFEGGVIVDLKVTGKTPSKMSHGHLRQGSFYQQFVPDCKRVDFVYLIPLKGGVKSITHTVTDSDKHIHDLRMGAIAMDKMLSISDDAMTLAPMFMPAPGDWWLNDPMAMSLASEVWGISIYEQPKEEKAA